MAGHKTVLAGDLGGTKANLALYALHDGRLQRLREEQFASARFDSAQELVRAYVDQLDVRPDTVCLGIAGPVNGDRVKTPNLPWVVTRREVRAATGVEDVYLINDLVATGYGVLALPDHSLEILNPGSQSEQGTIALLAAGTGLGQAVLYWDGQRYVPGPSEGGHSDFAPIGDLEIELLRYLQERLGHVSVERVVSGPGLHRIHRFLVDSGRGVADADVASRLETEDPAAVIGELGLSGSDATCAAAVKLFTRAYGAEAGNLALKTLARGGVYLGGGIAPKLLPALRSGLFMEAFTDKGRMSYLLQDIPVRVILDPKAALHGAGRYAALKEGWL